MDYLGYMGYTGCSGYKGYIGYEVIWVPWVIWVSAPCTNYRSILALFRSAAQGTSSLWITWAISFPISLLFQVSRPECVPSKKSIVPFPCCGSRSNKMRSDFMCPLFWGFGLSLLPVLFSSEKFRKLLLFFASKLASSWKWHRFVIFKKKNCFLLFTLFSS